MNIEQIVVNGMTLDVVADNKDVILLGSQNQIHIENMVGEMNLRFGAAMHNTIGFSSTGERIVGGMVLGWILRNEKGEQEGMMKKDLKFGWVVMFHKARWNAEKGSRHLIS